jgi:hypothetical protein
VRLGAAKVSLAPDKAIEKNLMFRAQIDEAWREGVQILSSGAAMPEAELEGYKGLRFTYKAQVPKGINGLLVMLRESDGTQYCATPPPQATEDWKTVTIPFDAFKKGGWCKDENDQLDLDQIGSISIGVHGTTTEKTGKGFIMTKEIQFVP